MKVKIWDGNNNQWLEPVVIFFGEGGDMIWKITARKPDSDIFADGWFDFAGETLKKVAITGDVNWNTEIIPKQWIRGGKTYRESCGLENPPKGTKLKIRKMSALGYCLIWPDCPDMENIVDGWFRVRRNAKAFAKENGWIV